MDYITTNKKGGTLYTGFTGDIIRRAWEHKSGFSKFSKRYNLDKLVYFEIHEDVMVARQRERNIKHWLREWKVALIEKDNPEWNDLWDLVIK